MPEQREAELVQQGSWHSELPQVLPARQEPQVPDRIALLEGEARQEIVQPPAAGE